MSLVPCLPHEMHLWRSSSNVPRLPSFLQLPQNPHVLHTFDKVHNPLRLPRKRPHMKRQKWSEHFLRATTTCTFWTSQIPKVARTWCVLYILTSKRASRHNGVQFFISHLASWLRTRHFSKVTFRPSGAPNHWKNTVNRDFPFFLHTCIFLLWSSHFFSSPLWLFPPLLFQLSILSEVSLLNFLR